MKKVISITLVTVVALSTVLTVGASSLYDFDRVKDIILSKAPDANITEVDLDYERGITVYEVDYYSNGVKHEAIIDASSGQILYEKSKTSYNNQYGQAAYPVASVTMEEAKDIVLDAIGTYDGNFIKEDFKQSKKKATYKFEVVADGFKYTAEVDAVTGYVKKLKQKAVNNTYNTAYTYIDVIDTEEAKYIASSDAGVSNPVYTEVKFKDKKSGAVYEIEFVSNGTEYEYKIDAATGTVLKRESEWKNR